MRRITMGLAGLCLAAVTLAGCADGSEPASESVSAPARESASESASESAGAPTSESAPEPEQSVDITFSGDSVEPNGERIEVALGEPLVMNVTADSPGEIHVHSTPEQTLAYAAGTTRVELTIDRPGVVVVESDELGLTILQLEVR